jgi:hypothetical protein
MNRLNSHLHFLHVLKDAKPQVRRALLASAAESYCRVCYKSSNGIHKLTIDEKRKLKKYNNYLRALVNPKFNFKRKRKLVVQKGVFIVPLLGSVLSGVIGSLINNN